MDFRPLLALLLTACALPAGVAPDDADPPEDAREDAPDSRPGVHVMPTSLASITHPTLVAVEPRATAPQQRSADEVEPRPGEPRTFEAPPEAEPPPPVVPQLAYYVEPLDEGGEYVEINPSGFPAISADGARLVVLDGDLDHPDDCRVVFRDTRTGRVVSRRPYPTTVAEVLALKGSIAGYSTLAAIGDFDEGFKADGLVVDRIGRDRRTVVVRDVVAGTTLHRSRLPSPLVLRSEAYDEPYHAELEIYGAWIAPDRSFAVVDVGSCVCWCDVDPEHRFLRLAS